MKLGLREVKEPTQYHADIGHVTPPCCEHFSLEDGMEQEVIDALRQEVKVKVAEGIVLQGMSKISRVHGGETTRQGEEHEEDPVPDGLGRLEGGQGTATVALEAF